MKDPEHPAKPVDGNQGLVPFRSLGDYLDVQSGLPAGADARREIRSQAIRKLELLDEIQRDLAEKAKRVIQTAARDIRLHEIPVNASKIRGKTYFLYRSPAQDSREFFSILPPEEYLRADPRAVHVGTFRLNEDGTWTALWESGESLDR